MSNNLRYIAYIRKSTEDSNMQVLSLQSQKARIHADFPELNIVKWMEPESKSAFKPGRPVFNEMLAIIDRGEANAIIAWHPNRLSRNEVDSSAITYRLRSGLKDLKFCSFTFNNSPEGVMFLQTAMNQSQYESSKQAVDVKRGMVTKAAGGERPGQVPQGYMKAPVLDLNGTMQMRKNKIVTQTVNDPDRFGMIKSAWQMFLYEGASVSYIQTELNDVLGYRTRKLAKSGGNPLTTSMMYKIFNNPFYAGVITHEGIEYKGSHQPMIGISEFDLAQKILGDRGKPRKSTFEYAFNGIIKCGKCGCSVIGYTKLKRVKSSGQFKPYTYYYCTRKSEKRPCNQNKYTTLQALEEQIESLLARVKILPEFEQFALDVIRDQNKSSMKTSANQLEELNKHKQRVNEQLGKLIDMRTRDLINDSEFTDQKFALKSKLAQISERLATLDIRNNEWLEDAENSIKFISQASEKYKNATSLEVKKSIMLGLGTNFKLIDQKLEVTLSPFLELVANRYPDLEKTYLWARTDKKTPSPDGDSVIYSVFETWRAI